MPSPMTVYERTCSKKVKSQKKHLEFSDMMVRIFREEGPSLGAEKAAH